MGRNPAVVAQTAALAQLQQCGQVKGNLVEAFEFKGPLTALLTHKAKDAQAAYLTRVALTRQGKGAQLECVALLKIGSTDGPWTQDLVKVQAAGLPKVTRKTIRLTAPEQYRTAFGQGKDSPTDVVAAVASHTKVAVSELSGGHWNRTTVAGCSQLVGVLWVKEEVALKLISMSGHKGIFSSYQESGRMRPVLDQKNA